VTRPDDLLNDLDQDGVCGDLDNCPGTSNPSQADLDADGRGDACEPEEGAWAPDALAKLLPVMGSGGSFGEVVAIDGDTLVVGQRLDDEVAGNAGAAHVFVRSVDAWVHQAKLTASDGDSSDGLGVSVAIDLDTTVGGAWHDSDMGLFSGAAYVFKRIGESWIEQAKLVPADGAQGDEFGRRVDVEGDTIVVAAAFDDDHGSSSGSVYVFTLANCVWSEQAKLIPHDGQPFDVFGSDVSLDGETLVVGASLDDERGEDSGSAYVYVRTGMDWNLQTKLVPIDGEEGAEFGKAVELDGDRLVIGGDGSAYVFHRANAQWTLRAKLVAVGVSTSDSYGSSVALSGDAALVGAPHDDDQGTNAGAAYLFTHVDGSWSPEAKLVAVDGANSDALGTALALDCTTAILGAPGDDDGGPNTGSAYEFRLGPADCSGACCFCPGDEDEDDDESGDEHGDVPAWNLSAMSNPAFGLGGLTENTPLGSPAPFSDEADDDEGDEALACDVTTESACALLGGLFLGSGTPCVDPNGSSACDTADEDEDEDGGGGGAPGSEPQVEDGPEGGTMHLDSSVVNDEPGSQQDDAGSTPRERRRDGERGPKPSGRRAHHRGL
jgi:hypothetical protein